MASVTDLLPTMCEAAGADLPPGLSGRSLWPLLKGEDEIDWRSEFAAVTTGSAPAIGCLQFALRTETHKLIVTPARQGQNRSAVAYLNQHNAHFIAGCNAEEIAAAPSKVQAAYATYLNPPSFELYDLVKDPHELVNLAASGAAADRKLLGEMVRRFRARQMETNDPFGRPGTAEYCQNALIG